MRKRRHSGTSGRVRRRGVASSGRTSQLCQHLLKTYCAPVEMLWIEMRPSPTALGGENFPEDTNHDSSMQNIPIGPRGVHC